MANGLVLGKLRFDTSELDRQLAEVTKRLNEVKQLAAQVKSAGGSSARSGGSGAKKDDFNAAAIREVTDLYRRMTTSYNEYVKALKEGNIQNQTYWSGQLNSANETMRLIKSNAEAQIAEADARKKVIDIINDSDTVMNRYHKTVRDTQKAEEELAKATKDAAQAQAKLNDEAQKKKDDKAEAKATKEAVEAVVNAYKRLAEARRQYLAS